jgi:hypothetical protein
MGQLQVWQLLGELKRKYQVKLDDPNVQEKNGISYLKQLFLSCTQMMRNSSNKSQAMYVLLNTCFD